MTQYPSYDGLPCGNPTNGGNACHLSFEGQGHRIVLDCHNTFFYPQFMGISPKYEGTFIPC